jgi:hypothetical protein
MAASKKPSASAKWRHGAGGRISGIAEEKAAAQNIGEAAMAQIETAANGGMANKREGGGGDWHRGAKIRRGENGGAWQWRNRESAWRQISIAWQQNAPAHLCWHRAPRTCTRAARLFSQRWHGMSGIGGIYFLHQRAGSM